MAYLEKYPEKKPSILNEFDKKLKEASANESNTEKKEEGK